jgi:hypothetical protein
LWGIRAPAQETDPPPAPAATSPPAAAAPSDAPQAAGPAIEASQLDTFMLRDSKGNLVPVLNLPFDEFERLLRIQRGLAAPDPPAYSLDALTLTGKAAASA